MALICCKASRLFMRLLWLWAAVQVLSAELPEDEVPGGKLRELFVGGALCLVDLRWIYIYMKTMNFQGAMIHNLECVSRDFFLEVIQNLWIFGCFPKKLGRFRMSEQKPCLRERMVVLPGRCSHCV